MATNKEFDDVQLDVAFTTASSRSNLVSGENISVSFGKISKYFNDLHNQAFTGLSAGRGLTLNGTLIDHTDGITPRTKPDHETKFVSYNNTGHITGSSNFAHTAKGTPGVSGWVKIAVMSHTQTYNNSPITLTINQRGNTPTYRLMIRFTSVNTQTPDLSLFLMTSDVLWGTITPKAYIYQSNQATWELYIEKRDTYETIAVTDVDMGGTVDTKTIWAWVDEQVDELPEGGVEADKKVYSLSTHTHTISQITDFPTLAPSATQTGTVGSVGLPVYLNSGTITACSIPSSGAWWNTSNPRVPQVSTSGVLEMGRYLDFHATAASTNNFDIRFDAADTSVLVMRSNDGTPNLKLEGTLPRLRFTQTTSGAAHDSIYTGITAYPGSTDGLALVMQSGGMTFIGSGEAGQNGYPRMISSSVAADDTSRNPYLVSGFLQEPLTGSSEVLVLSSDNGIYFQLNMPNSSTVPTDWSNLKTLMIDTGGNFKPTITNKGQLGTSTYQWNAAYINTIYENGTSLANKYAPKTHTHTTSDITNLSSTYLPLAGGTMSGDITCPGTNGRSLVVGSGRIVYNVGTSGAWAGGLIYYDGASSPAVNLGGFGAYGTPNTLTYHWIGGTYDAPQIKIEPTGPNLIINSEDASSPMITFFRKGSNRVDWRIACTTGNLKFQSDYTTAIGDWYDVLDMQYNTGNITMKTDALFTFGKFEDGTANANRHVFFKHNTANRICTNDNFKYNPSTNVLTVGSITGTASNVTGTVAIANGGTGATSRLNALKALTNESVGTDATYFLTITTSWAKGGYSSVADVKSILGIGGGIANHLAFYDSATSVTSTANITYAVQNSTATTPRSRTILNIFNSNTVGNDASALISGTKGVLSYGDGGPQINFSTSGSIGSAQDSAIIWTDNDSAAYGASWHFVSNQSDWTVVSKRFHAKSGITIGTDVTPILNATTAANTPNLYVVGTAGITGNSTIGGTLDVTNTISQNGTPVALSRIGKVGSDAATSNGWYKVASGTLTGYANTVLKFAVHNSSPGHAGILFMDLRCNNGSTLSSTKFGWLTRHGYDPDDFILNFNGNNWTLYQNVTRTQYYRDFWTVLAESSTNGLTASYTLYTDSTKESTAPTPTVTSQDIGVVKIAATLKTNTLTAGTLDTTDGSFVFGGTNLLGNINDWVGFQADAGNDRFQIIAHTGLIYRQNDGNSAASGTWGAWKRCMIPQDISADTGLSTTITTTTVGSGDTAFTYDSGVKISHTNSVTAVTTAGMLKVKYDAQGHITGSSAIAKADITGLGIAETDENVKQTIATGSGTRPLLMAYSTNDVATTDVTNKVYRNNNIYAQPSTGSIFSTRMKSKIINNMISGGTAVAGQDKGSGVSPRYFPAQWTFDTGLTPSDGDVFIIKIPGAGHSAGVWLSIDNGSNYYPVSNNGATRLQTQFGANYFIAIMFKSDGKTTTYPINGADSTGSYPTNGGCWIVLNYYDSGNSNTVPSAYCTTAAGTAAKTATCTNYALTSKTWLHVLIQNANTSKSALTLSVNSKTAKPIYINGSASSASNYTLPAGTYLVYYNGTNYYFRTDGKLDADITGTADKVSAAGLVTAIYGLNATTDSQHYDGTETLITSIPSASGTSTPNYQRVTFAHFAEELIATRRLVMFENASNTSATLSNLPLLTGANTLEITVKSTGNSGQSGTDNAVYSVITVPYMTNTWLGGSVQVFQLSDGQGALKLVLAPIIAKLTVSGGKGTLTVTNGSSMKIDGSSVATMTSYSFNVVKVVAKI